MVRIDDYRANLPRAIRWTSRPAYDRCLWAVIPALGLRSWLFGKKDWAFPRASHNSFPGIGFRFSSDLFCLADYKGIRFAGCLERAGYRQGAQGVRIFFLSTGWTLVLCFVVWTVINLSVVAICLYLPDKLFNPYAFIFRSHPFEKEGQIYEKAFKVKQWKHLLPDGGGLWKKRGYKKRHLEDFSHDNLERFLIESCRAELTHWLAISFVWVFGFFLPASATLLMLIIALLGNLPCIIPQRYNRPRFLKLLEKTQSNQRAGTPPVSWWRSESLTKKRETILIASRLSRRSGCVIQPDIINYLLFCFQLAVNKRPYKYNQADDQCNDHGWILRIEAIG